MTKGHHVKHKEPSQSAPKQKGKHPENPPPPPTPGPWSRWFPQENGRWFYKARMLPNGHWDYAFTEGYPTGAQIGATYSAVRTTYPTPETIPGVFPAPGQYVQSVSRQRAVGAVQGADAQAQSQRPSWSKGPEEDDTEDEELSVVSSKHKKAHSKGKTKGTSEKSKDKSSKKLTGVVKAEKQLHVSSSKKVRGWLSEIGDSD